MHDSPSITSDGFARAERHHGASISCMRRVNLVGSFAGVFAAACLLGGCYEHVTHAGITSTEVREKYEPNVEEEGPSWLNEFMWGEPPKGEDAVRYYRRMNSMGLQQ